MNNVNLVEAVSEVETMKSKRFEFNYHGFILSCMETGMSKGRKIDTFQSSFTKGYLQNRIVELKALGIDDGEISVFEDVLKYLLALYLCYSECESDSFKADKLGRFIGDFVCRCELEGLFEVSKLDNVITQFVEGIA